MFFKGEQNSTLKERKAFWWLIFSYNIWYWATSQLALLGKKVFSQLNRDKCLVSCLHLRVGEPRYEKEEKERFVSEVTSSWWSLKIFLHSGSHSELATIPRGHNTVRIQTFIYQIYRTLFTLSINMSSVYLARCLLYLFSLHIYNQCIRFQTIWRTKYNKQHNSE